MNILKLPQSAQRSGEAKENLTNSEENLQQKVKELQGQICFIKKEHIMMLNSLHKEIELLKIKNKGKFLYTNAIQGLLKVITIST